MRGASERQDINDATVLTRELYSCKHEGNMHFVSHVANHLAEQRTYNIQHTIWVPIGIRNGLEPQMFGRVRAGWNKMEVGNDRSHAGRWGVVL